MDFNGYRKGEFYVHLDKVEEALEDLRNGKIVLVTDEPNRENEGDFICAAQFATTENINFMATHRKRSYLYADVKGIC